MPLITGRTHVMEVMAEAAERRWVLPAFNTENLTTTEAILAATLDHAQALGVANLPIMIGITGTYAHRPQAAYYAHSRHTETGLRLFLADLRVLCEPPSPYAGLRVLAHFDHAQWDSDEYLVSRYLPEFSSIMFDASTLPLEENTARTAEFVKHHQRELLIEGCCDGIPDAGKAADGVELTDPAVAERYWRETGVDLLVANVGTEHRAASAAPCYRDDVAKAIAARVGARLCLHGASSADQTQLRTLFDDGIRRVNLWTVLERDSAPALLAAMQLHASRIAGAGSQLPFIATSWRQEIVFKEMRRITASYLKLWYV